MYSQNLFNFISENEGRRLQTYTDTLGHPTVGVGFNLDRVGARKTIEALGLDFEAVRSGKVSLTNDHVDQLLAADVTQSQTQLRKMFPDILSFSTERQMALTDMMFNLGATRFRGFQNMIKAIKAEDWNKAADEAQDSTWFNQVGRRGPIIVNMLRNG